MILNSLNIINCLVFVWFWSNIYIKIYDLSTPFIWDTFIANLGFLFKLVIQAGPVKILQILSQSQHSKYVLGWDVKSQLNTEILRAFFGSNCAHEPEDVRRVK